MILIRRPSTPPGLLINQAKWTNRWNRRPKKWATVSAQRLLREHLLPITHNKCAYCESVLGGGARFEVEHYDTKASQPDLSFEWTNLFPTCGLCNGFKGGKAHNGALLKPDIDDGELHFWLNTANGEIQPRTGLDRNGKIRAEATIKLCGLNRGVLCHDRRKQYRSAKRYLDAIAQRSKLPKELVLNFVGFLDPGEAYKLAIRSALPKRLADVDRRMYHAAD